jgi:hypothetical protein
MPRRRTDDDRWAIRIGPGGWATVTQHPPAGESPKEHVLVRVVPDDADRYRIHELHVLDAGEPVTADRLRAVRVSAIEQLLNLPEERALIQAQLDDPSDENLSFFLPGFLKRFSALRLRGSEAARTSPGTELSPPSGRGYPDDFYERVANAYRNALRRGLRPVAAIAAEANVPRSTAARWVKEARRRPGLLGPAPAPGKAGE